ncbi:23S rRNA (cytidine(2498)-2'-O)-methyltransferase RlmM [bacterium]|nr:23S rRNA (cytidine(2498)-2'-O)-methyltransferase RlmM [bacterium]
MKPLVLAYCREGFENEAGEELAARAVEILGLRRKPVPVMRANAAFAYLPLANVEELLGLRKKLDFDSLVFARQIAFGFGPLELGDVRDRAAPIAAAALDTIFAAAGIQYNKLAVTFPDNNDGKELTRFAKLVHPAMSKSLGKSGFVAKAGARGLPTFNVFFYDKAKSAMLTWIDPGNSSPWLDGVARLKFPPSAPSRSTLKLEEAFHVFMDKDQRDQLLRPGLTVVDLGASPGGWTWQFVHREMFVTAVDNGNMDDALMASGMVDHKATDAFRYVPKSPVDWMVCDVVEQPSRVAKLAAQWIKDGNCRNLVVNLKLPMKQRREEVLKCLDILREAAASARGASSKRPWQFAARQLYHDRREVTVFASSLIHSI